MSGGDDDGASPGLSAEEAFALLGNEYRARIVKALGDAQGTRGPRPRLSFSTLYERADVDVATSQFNYHLQKLVGPFLERGPDGYRLRHEAVALYRTILAGTYTREPADETVPVDAACFHCGAGIEARYADRRCTVACPDCGRRYSDSTAPPSLADGDRTEVLSRIDQYVRHRVLAFAKGVCSVCASGLETAFLPESAVATVGTDPLDVFVHRSCGHCGAQQYMSVGLALLYDAALVSFFEQRGLDVTETPVWELEFAMTDRGVTVRSRDPWTVALCVRRDGDELEMVVDDELSVVERTRR
jgi:hypothetical protein